MNKMINIKTLYSLLPIMIATKTQYFLIRTIILIMINKDIITRIIFKGLNSSARK